MDEELDRLALRYGIRPGLRENVGEAAARLGTTPRMLRYGERDLLAAAYGGALAVGFEITPAALAFALRALAEPDVAGRLRTLARLAGRGGDPTRSAALDFETSKARRLLRLAS